MIREGGNVRNRGVAILILPKHSDAEIRIFLLLVAPYIALRALARIPLMFMQACKQIKRAARFTLITQTISLVAVVIAATQFGLWGFFIVIGVAPFSNFLILLFVTRRRLHWFLPTLTWLKKLLGLGRRRGSQTK